MHLSLRVKTWLIIGMGLLGLSALFHVVAHAILKQGFDRVEQDTARLDVARVVEALGQEIASLERTTYDYAEWDQTYAYMADRNAEFVERELVNEVLLHNHIDQVLLLDTEGHLVFGKGVAPAQETTAALLPSFLKAVTSETLVGNPPARHRGLIVLPEGPLLVVTSPILTSQQTGPYHGVLIMGRFIDREVRENLVERTHIQFGLEDLAMPGVASRWREISGKEPGEEFTAVRPAGPDTVVGYRVLRDIQDNPALLLHAEMPRNIHRQSLAVARHLWISLVLIALLGCVLTLFLMERFVLARLARVAAAVRSIGDTRDLSIRIPTSGRDELGALVGAINSTLSMAEDSQKALRARDAILEASSFATERFLKVSQWEEELPEVLARLGRASGASRVHVTQLQPDSAGSMTAHRTYEWVADGVAPLQTDLALQSPSSQVAGLQRWDGILAAGGILRAHASESTGGERAFLERIGAASVLLAPVFVEGAWRGVLGFNACGSQREWSSADVELLRAAADTLGAAIARRRIEEELARSEQRYRSVVESVREVIFQTDADGRWLLLNPAWTDITGYSVEESLGHVFLEFVHPADRAENLERLKLLMEGKQETSRHVVRYVAKDGGFRWIEVHTRVLLGPQKQPIGRTGILADITERKEAEEALRDRTDELSAANAALARASRLKDEFLANMSHELRTPLNTILGMSEALRELVYGDLNEKQAHSLLHIEESGRHLLSLINDILDLSKIEAGKIQLDIGPVHVETLCQASMLLVRQIGQQKGLQLATQIDPQATVVQGDERRLKQILVNLLSNAIKFTPPGGRVSLDVIGDAQAQVMRFTVRDTGIGIATTDVSRLFRPFVQLDSRLSRHYEGTGLGLSLVQRFTELHGGGVALESDPGQGSAFTVTLPWTPGVMEAGPTETHAPHVCRPTLHKALLVEGAPSAAEQIGRYLVGAGLEVTHCACALSARETAATLRPDLILLDIPLPDMDGWKLLRQLKEDAATRSTPIVVVSVVDDRARGISLGASDYLLKPVARSQLLDCLRRLFGDLETGSATAEGGNAADCKPPAAGDHSGIPLLLAEDNESNITTLGDYLRARGYRVTVARDGHEAVECAHRERPALILMDVQMPKMDGLEATRRIRSAPQTRDIPIIALTALAMPGDRERCLAAGANDYLTKPVSLRVLVETITRHLESGTTELEAA